MTRKKEGKKWVAKIEGLDSKYGFKREFIAPKEIEWGKKGMRVARFEIKECGFYQDSDGDYFKVFVIDNKLEAETCSWMEVKTSFSVA